MAQVSGHHVTPLAMGFVGLLTFSLVGLAVLNYMANH